MADLNFSQTERRSYLVPTLLALAVLIAFLGYFYLRTPMRIADLTVTHSAIVPTHTVFKSDTKLVGAQDQAQDDLYVVTTVRVDNHLKVPLFLSDITGTLTAPDDSTTDTSAIHKSDLSNLYTTFPALRPIAGEPLARESTIAPGDHAEGTVILHYPFPEADWNNRKSATVTVTFYHQGTAVATIPK